MSSQLRDEDASEVKFMKNRERNTIEKEASGTSKLRIIGVLGWLTLLTLCSHNVCAQSARDFGYGNMKVNNVKAEGRRPLLVILLEIKSDRFPADHTRGYYDRLFFGPTFPNVVKYFTENSYGKFTWSRAAILGPIPISYIPSTLGARERPAALDLASTAGGLNFATYDRNRDGVVSGDELGIIVINSGSTLIDAAQTQDIYYTPSGSRVTLNLSMTAAGQRLSFTTAAHELSHQLGTVDIYGSNCLNDHLSLLGCTAGVPDKLRPYHMDPWHKIQLGWIEPSIFHHTVQGCETLEAAQNGGSYATPNKRPIIIHDSIRGTNEFFILEYRTPSPPTGGSYDAGAADQGLAIWYVKTRPDKSLSSDIPGRVQAGRDGVLQTRPARGSDDVMDGDSILPGLDSILQSTPVSGSDDALYTDAPDFLYSAPSGARGGTRLWKPTDGMFTIYWPGRIGTYLQFRVGLMSAIAPNIAVEWGVSGDFVPYVERYLSVAPFHAGSSITVEGKFGALQASRTICLLRVSPSGVRIRYDLLVEAWGVTRVGFRVPPILTPGNYRLVIYNDTLRTIYGTGVDFVIAR